MENNSVLINYLQEVSNPRNGQRSFLILIKSDTGNIYRSASNWISYKGNTKECRADILDRLNGKNITNQVFNDIIPNCDFSGMPLFELADTEIIRELLYSEYLQPTLTTL